MKVTLSALFASASAGNVLRSLGGHEGGYEHKLGCDAEHMEECVPKVKEFRQIRATLQYNLAEALATARLKGQKMECDAMQANGTAFTHVTPQGDEDVFFAIFARQCEFNGIDMLWEYMSSTDPAKRAECAEKFMWHLDGCMAKHIVRRAYRPPNSTENRDFNLDAPAEEEQEAPAGNHTETADNATAPVEPEPFQMPPSIVALEQQRNSVVEKLTMDLSMLRLTAQNTTQHALFADDEGDEVLLNRFDDSWAATYLVFAEKCHYGCAHPLAGLEGYINCVANEWDNSAELVKCGRLVEKSFFCFDQCGIEHLVRKQLEY